MKFARPRTSLDYNHNANRNWNAVAIPRNNEDQRSPASVKAPTIEKTIISSPIAIKKNGMKKIIKRLNNSFSQMHHK